MNKSSPFVRSFALAVLMFAVAAVHGQGRAPVGPPPQENATPIGPPPSSKAAAPFDANGYWVSLVTRDWRFRMVVPGPGEYSGVPLNLEAKKFADAWNAAADEAAGKQCSAYGAATVMLIPERLHVSWQDDETIKVETDAGGQTRLLHFKPNANAEKPAPSLQGYSTASWIMHQPIPFFPQPMPPIREKFGQLMVTTNNMVGGLLRKNGLPYSNQATQTEYWEIHNGPGGAYLIVTSVLHDPVYLESDYYTTATFRREANGAKWHPTPCTLTSTP